jgi:hypothetical protein
MSGVDVVGAGGAPESFTEKAEEYRRIHQGISSYGEGSRSEQAMRFYLDHLLGSAAERTCRKRHAARTSGSAHQPVRVHSNTDDPDARIAAAKSDGCGGIP